MEPYLASNALPAGITCAHAWQNACTVAAAVKGAHRIPACWLHHRQQGELRSFLHRNVSIVPTVQCDWLWQLVSRPLHHSMQLWI